MQFTILAKIQSPLVSGPVAPLTGCLNATCLPVANGSCPANASFLFLVVNLRGADPAAVPEADPTFELAGEGLEEARGYGKEEGCFEVPGRGKGAEGGPGELVRETAGDARGEGAAEVPSIFRFL